MTTGKSTLVNGREQFWILDVDHCVRSQTKLVGAWNRDGSPGKDLPAGSVERLGCPAAVIANHRHNQRLWTLEDEARRPDYDDAAVGAVKRAIDRENQLRNDTVETLDREIRQRLGEHGIRPGPDVHQHSETPGAIVDRLSILALKVFHMTREADRRDAPEQHRRTCLDRALALRRQRSDLHDALRRLVLSLERGDSRMELYQQFKMYNDPALNPAIYLRADDEQKEQKCTY